MPRPLNRRQWLAATGALAATTLARPLQAAAVQPTGSTPARTQPIRLMSNENPLGPSEAARAAMQDAFDLGCRYHFEAHETLRALIAEAEGVTPDHVFLGAGSHEILRMAGTAYGLDGGEVVVGDPTYERMARYAEAAGARIHRVPLTPDTFALDLDAMDRRTTNGVRLVFVCNPNNPTGTLVDADAVEDFCRSVARRAVVFVDEAYHEYVDDPAYRSMVPLVRDGHNVIISRTFSKIHGLAGLRVGYGLARPDIAQRVTAFITGGGVNVLGAHAALAAYRDADFVTASRQQNAEARQFLYRTFDELGYRYLRSHTNFVFMHLGRPVQGFRAEMERQGVLVGRPFPPMTDWCRVSLSTMDDLEVFASALRVMSSP
ncbi:MAG: histidinol-phosphate transaminase [Bacteroidota bacterium]